MSLRPGLRGTARLAVQATDTAQALGSGEVEVLGTPRLLALVEAAAVDALRGRLDEGATSVGTRVELEHLAATPLGGTVEAEAMLREVEGRILRFEVSARDGHGQAVARGVHERAVVDRRRFMERVERTTRA